MSYISVYALFFYLWKMMTIVCNNYVGKTWLKWKYCGFNSFPDEKIINFSMFRLKRKEALANLSYYDAFVFLDLESSEIFQNGGQKRQNLTRLHVPYLYTPTTWSQHTFNTSIQLHSWRHFFCTPVLILMIQCLLTKPTLNSNNLLY